MVKRLFLILLLALVAWLLWEWITFPDVAALADQRPGTTAFMERRQKELRRDGKDDTIHYTWVPYGRISPNLRRAVLVAEDDSFYEHEGVDVEGLKEAMRRNWESGSARRGGSTITQQLAKNLYLSPSRNPYRKVKEYLIARALERELSKKRILELYLNVVEFGERWYGAEAAARHYFDKPASALTTRQAALLAGCLPNPRVMNPAKPNKRLRWRQNMIVSRMRRWGYMAEREVLASKPKKEKPAPTPTPDAATTPAPDVTDTDLAPDLPVEEPAQENEPVPAATATPVSEPADEIPTATPEPQPSPGSEL